MPALTRKRVNDRPITWHVHYAGVRVGVIVERSGVPRSARSVCKPSKWKFLSIFLATVVFARTTPAISADQVMIAGIGSKSCTYWTSTPALKSEGEKWALGFWSGLNYVAAVTRDQNQLIIDPDKMLAEIEKMCAQRPSQSLADTVWVTFLTLNKSQ
jgi:hypothetical protein